MNKIKTVPENKKQPGRPQLIFEKILEYGVLFLALVHMLSALTRYIIDHFEFIRPFESWYTVVLLAAGIIYLFLSLIFWRGTAYRLKVFIKRLISPAQIYCAVLFFWYILVCKINQDEYTGSFFKLNDWWLLDTFINCILIFSLPRFFSDDKGKQKIDVLLHIVVLAGTVISVYALHCLFTLNVVTLPGGGQIGMTKSSTFLVGTHYNTSAAIELSMILVCFYMLASQKVILKIPYAAALAVHTYVLLLNNSRTAFVACMLSYALALFLLLWNFLYKKPLILRWIAGFLGAAAAAGIIWMARPMAFQYFEDVTHFSEILAAQKSELSVIRTAAADIPHDSPAIVISRQQYGHSFVVRPEQTTGNYPVKRPYAAKNAVYQEKDRPLWYLAENEGDQSVRELDEYMNREGVWKLAIKVMGSNKLAFFFGVTPAGVPLALKELGETRANFAHAHNEALQMGVSMGVPMMVLFIVFLVYMTIKSIQLGMIRGRTLFRGAYMIPVFFAGFAAASLTEAYLFGYYSIMSSLFFLFCGWINALTLKKTEAGKNE